MRLLEFSKDAGGANPQRSRMRRTKGEPDALRSQPKPASQPASAGLAPGTPKMHADNYPIHGSAVRKLVQRGPIDLELLQQRIGFLERRLQEQSDTVEQLATRQDLDQLRQRMNQMEQTLAGELATARTREDRLLQALDRPPLKVLVKTRALQFWQHDLPRIAAWLLKMARGVWQEIQPEWWPQFANAWKESLEKARR